MSTQITVKQCELAFGDTVKVVGESDLFGSWDSDKGLDLEWQDGHDWVAKLEVPPGDCIFKVGQAEQQSLQTHACLLLNELVLLAYALAAFDWQ